MTTQDSTVQSVKYQSGLTLKWGDCSNQLLRTPYFSDLRHMTASSARLLHGFDWFLITARFVAVDNMCDRMHALHSL